MKKYILTLLTIIFFLSCNNDNENTSLIDAFHANYYDVNIKPALQNFKNQIENQATLLEAFKENSTKDNFEAIQNQWLLSAKSFTKSTTYNVVAVKASFYHLIIYNFEISPSKIEENIKEQTIFNEDYFSKQSTVTRGLGTIEYLLFNNQDTDKAYDLLKEDSYRIDYLIGANNNVLTKTNELIDFWESDYKETFKNATNTSCVNNARCLAFNQLINVLDVIRVSKLGKPAGLESSSGANVEGLEAFRSENSLELLKAALEEIKYVYSDSSINFSELVNDISGSTDVSKEIDTGFNNTFAIIDAIDTSLYTAILNEDPNVELLYKSLFTLVQYFSVDAASVLSVTILPTDNDGD